MNGSDIFGQIIDANQVEQAVIAHIQLWEETYLAEIERQRGLEPRSLPTFRSFITTNEWQHWPEDQIPGLLVVSPGLASDPIKSGNGSYRAKWAVGLGVFASGQDKPSTMELAKLYSAVVRAAILQHESLGGFAQGVTWKTEQYTDLPPDRQRTLASGQVIFEVEVANVITANAGPVVPPADPYADPAVPESIEEVQVGVTVMED